MALTQTAEYALRAVVWLAQNPGQPQTTQQIADATQVPPSYLPKVFQPLVRSGLVNGQRGLRGGYSLRKEPCEITLLEVVNQVDPIQRIDSCPLALAGHRGRLCPLHGLLSRILAAEEKALREACIGDLIDRPGQLAPLCDARAALQRAVAGPRAGAQAHGSSSANGQSPTNGNGAHHGNGSAPAPPETPRGPAAAGPQTEPADDVRH